MEVRVINKDDELYHYGILGMKWGVRRYQNKDGSLTPRGQKRYNKEMDKLKEKERVLKNKEKTAAKLAKLDAKKKELEERQKALDEAENTKKKSSDNSDKSTKVESSKPKKLSEMSDDEIRQAITRIKLEQEYKSLTPQEVSKGQKMAEAFGEKVLNSVATTVPELLKNTVNKAVDNAIKKNEQPNKDEKTKAALNIENQRLQNERMKVTIENLRKQHEDKPEKPKSDYDRLQEEYNMAKLKQEFEDFKKEQQKKKDDK